MVQNAISGVKSFVGGLLGGKSTPTAPTPPQVPSWAVAAKPPAAPATPQTKPPSWAVPAGAADQKKTFTPTPPGPGSFPATPPSTKVSESTPETTTEPNPLVGLAQALPRDAATIGVSAGQAIANIISPKLGAAADTSVDTSKFGGELGRIVLGTDPITGLADTAAQYETAIKNSAFAKKFGLDKHSTTLAILGSTVPISLDFLGMGGETSAIDALARASTAEEAAKVLRQIGVHEDLIPAAADEFSRITDKAEVKKGLDTIDALQKSSIASHPPESESFINDKPTGADVLPKEDIVAAATDESTKVPDAAAKGADEAAVAETPKPVEKPPRPVEQVQSHLEELLAQKSWYEDVIVDHPGRTLSKYRSSSTGELPEIRGKTAKEKVGADTRGKFNKSGDTIIQEIMGQDPSNGGDIEAGNAALASYTKIRDQLRQTDASIKQLRAELKLSKEQDALREEQQKALRSQEKNRQPFEKKTRAERIEGSPGDLLRRGAEVVRSGRGKEISATMPRGMASEISQRSAVGETIHGHIESGPFKGFSTRMKNWFQDWVFQRQAVQAEVKVTLRQFESLKGADMDWVYEYLGKNIDNRDGRIVEGTRSRYGNFGLIEKKLSQWLDEEQAAGIKVAEKDNYFPIYLKNAPSMGEDMLAGRHVGLRPGFSMQSQFKDYVEAKAAGYDPLYTNPYDILKARASAHFKAMADANMFREGVQKGWIVPKEAIAPGMKGQFRDLSSERFPTQSTVYGNTIYRGVYSAPEKLAEKINNYLANPDSKLSKIATVARNVKNVALSVGIPGTGVSIHFWNVLPRDIALDFAISPLKAPFETARYAYYAINPRAAQRFIDQNLKEALPLIRAGMKVSTEEHQPFADLAKAFEKNQEGVYTETAASRASETAKAMTNWIHKIFGGNTFDKLLPARKIGNGIKLMGVYEKAGYSADEAARLAADDINTVYGGINWESLGRSRQWQSVFQSIAMAPDYAETNMRLGSRIAKAFLDPKSVQGRVYRSMMYLYMGSYIASNLINYENSGHWMPSNDILHQFSIDMGKASNGKERYFNLYGTGVDFIRLPLLVATALGRGSIADLDSILLNRMSIPLRSSMSMLLNVDWKGDPIYGPDKYGRPQSMGQQSANIESNTVGSALPGSLGDLGSLIKGQTSPQTAISEALGLPLTEKNIQPTTSDINALKAKAATDIANGDYTLYNKLVKAKVITSRSRATFIRQALAGGAKTAAQLRTAAKTKVKTAAEKSALQAEGFTNQL